MLTSDGISTGCSDSSSSAVHSSPQQLFTRYHNSCSLITIATVRLTAVLLPKLDKIGYNTMVFNKKSEGVCKRLHDDVLHI